MFMHLKTKIRQGDSYSRVEFQNPSRDLTEPYSLSLHHVYSVVRSERLATKTEFLLNPGDILEFSEVRDSLKPAMTISQSTKRVALALNAGLSGRWDKFFKSRPQVIAHDPDDEDARSRMFELKLPRGLFFFSSSKQLLYVLGYSDSQIFQTRIDELGLPDHLLVTVGNSFRVIYVVKNDLPYAHPSRLDGPDLKWYSEDTVRDSYSRSKRRNRFEERNLNSTPRDAIRRALPADFAAPILVPAVEPPLPVPVEHIDVLGGQPRHKRSIGGTLEVFLSGMDKIVTPAPTKDVQRMRNALVMSISVGLITVPNRIINPSVEVKKHKRVIQWLAMFEQILGNKAPELRLTDQILIATVLFQSMDDLLSVLSRSDVPGEDHLAAIAVLNFYLDKILEKMGGDSDTVGVVGQIKKLLKAHSELIVKSPEAPHAKIVEVPVPDAAAGAVVVKKTGAGAV